MCYAGKELSLKLINNPMVGGTKLNFVSMEQMTNEHILVVVQMKKFKQILGEARKDGSSPNHIRGMLVRCMDVLTNRLFTKISAKTWKVSLLNKKLIA